MNNKNISGIILEGVAGTGKTTTLYKLLASKYWNNKPFLSSVILSEHHTLRVLENKRLDKTHTKNDSVELLDDHIDYLEAIRTKLKQTSWLERDRTAQKMPFVLERFHLSHVYHHDNVAWTDVDSIDKKLYNLNAKLFIFTIKPEDMKHRIIEDYNKSGWQDYLKTIGKNDSEIIEYFSKKQEEYLSMAKRSHLDTVLIDSSTMDTDSIVKIIFDEWQLY